LRGANPNIKDNKGRIPLDLVKDVRDKGFVDDLERMLSNSGSGSLTECLMLRAPSRPVNQNNKTLIMFCLLFIAVYIL
jgi:hypothetical protein